jgi:3,5-epimerase/4-reductase
MNNFSIFSKTDIEEVYFAKTKKFEDNRGWFSELFRLTNINAFVPNSCQQLSLSFSQKNVIRGMHCSPYWKIVVCLSGSVQDVIVDLRNDSKSYLRKIELNLDSKNNNIVIIPPGCAHGFCTLEENTQIMYIQSGEYSIVKDREFSPYDSLLNWPIRYEEAIISNKDENNKSLTELLNRLEDESWIMNIQRKCDIILMGTNGYIGGQFRKYFENNMTNYRVFIWNDRLENRETFQRVLDYCTPKMVICCSGIAGKPNIDWCKTHIQETMTTNLLEQLYVSEECRKRKIHCTLILTGALYDSNKLNKLYGEEDEPNCNEHIYYELRKIEEYLLRIGGYVNDEGNVLGLRVLYPVSGDMHERSLLSKLLKFENIFETETSITIMDELIPLAVKMAENRKVGIYNFTNPNGIKYSKLIELYKNIIDKNKNCNINPNSNTNRSSCILDTTKLEKTAEELGIQINDVESGIIKMLNNYKNKML